MSDDLIIQLTQENKELTARIDSLEQKRWELDKKIFELKVLYEIAKETTTTHDIHTMLRVFLSMIMGTFGISKGLIIIDNDDQAGWKIATSWGVDFQLEGDQKIDVNEFEHLAQINDTWIINTDLPDSTRDFSTTKLFQWLLSIPIKVWAPIIISKKVIGGICVGEKISGEEFYEENLNLLSIIASNCALNIRNARLFQGNLQKERIERENEELKRIDKKKSEFVNMVAHELRTPLTSISGFSELMMKKADTKTRETLQRYSQIIFQESDRLRRIINDLLDLSRIKSGKVEMEKKQNDFRKVLEIALTNVQLLAEKKNITMHYDFPEAINWFFFDEDKVTQVLVNLLSNAIKYTLEGGEVTVAVTLSDSHLNCVISDTGVGIPKNDLKKIFEEFHRVNNEISKSERGTGLGLSITKSIIDAHNGIIGVESKVGVGSTFHFSLPLDTSSS